MTYTVKYNVLNDSTTIPPPPPPPTLPYYGKCHNKVDKLITSKFPSPTSASFKCIVTLGLTIHCNIA